MKRFIVLILAALSALFLLSSCSFNIADRLDRFVTKVEKESASYTQEDWETANEKFEALCETYQKEKGSLTMDQVKQARSAIARYVSLVIRSGVDSAAASIEQIGEQIPGLIQEVGEAVPGLLESIGNALRDLGQSLSAPPQDKPAE